MIAAQEKKPAQKCSLLLTWITMLELPKGTSFIRKNKKIGTIKAFVRKTILDKELLNDI